MVYVTSASRYVTSVSRYQSRSSMYVRGLIPQNSVEFAEVVPIGFYHAIAQMYDYVPDSLYGHVNCLIGSHSARTLPVF